MSTFKRGSDQANSGADRLHGHEAQARMNDGRDARGRFAPGNVGGPGNPFARRVAELRKVLLETVTDDEMRIVAGQLMVKAKFGELPAIKLLFQYVLGKPAATVDPDTLDLDELDLYRRAPTPAQFREASDERLPADAVADVLRVTLPCVGAELKDRVARAVLGMGPDGAPLRDGDEEAQELDESNHEADDDRFQEPASSKRASGQDVAGAPVEPPAAPSTNGERNAYPRQMRTRPSTNGGFLDAEARRLAAGYSDNQRRPPGTRDGERRPPHAT
jgi:hypothetical protein